MISTCYRPAESAALAANYRTVLAALGDCRSLQVVRVGPQNLGVPNTRALTDSLSQRTLARLDLCSCRIRDAGALALGTAMTAAGPRSALAWLSLRANQISPAGVAAVADGVRACAALQHLDLSYNSAQPAGAFKLAAALRAHPSLAGLDVSNCAIGDAGLHAVASALRLVPPSPASTSPPTPQPSRALPDPLPRLLEFTDPTAPPRRCPHAHP
ncbi:hypothetical protein HK405_007035 [Cladochytrium tenue]|nr:hypothetical protein HK405_007035 [Cladochytrium tenue]